MKTAQQVLFPPSARWCQDGANGVQLHLYVQPNTKVTEVAGEFNGALKIRLNAPPVDGKANQALCAWLAECLNVPNHAVQLKAGHTSRYKQIRITAVNLNAQAIRDALSDNA